MPDPVLQARSKLALLNRENIASTPEQIRDAKRDLAAAKLSAAVEKILASAPPITDAQAQRIVALLMTGGGAADA
jgi:hypothetical protein